MAEGEESEKEGRVPLEDWSSEMPFDSSIYLKRAALPPRAARQDPSSSSAKPSGAVQAQPTPPVAVLPTTSVEVTASNGSRINLAAWVRSVNAFDSIEQQKTWIARLTRADRDAAAQYIGAISGGGFNRLKSLVLVAQFAAGQPQAGDDDAQAEAPSHPDQRPEDTPS